MYRMTRFGVLVVMDPDKAAAELLNQFDAAAGSTQWVATHMGVHTSTVKRWVCKLAKQCPGIRGQIEEMRIHAKAICEN